MISMDNMASCTKTDFIVDVESGCEAETTTEDEENGGDDDKDSDSDVKHPKKILSRLRSGHVMKDRSTKDSDGLGRIKHFVINFDEKMVEKADQENFGDHQKRKITNEKRKKSMSLNKKHPKPPRPPGRPSLDAADMKFVKEISELAWLRRSRRERLKTLKKMKANKPPSSNINLVAMVITIVFCLVIIFQGISGSRG